MGPCGSRRGSRRGRPRRTLARGAKGWNARRRAQRRGMRLGVSCFSARAVANARYVTGRRSMREFRNLVERVVMTTRGEEIGVEDLPAPIQALATGPAAIAARDAIVEESLAEVVDYRARVEKLERQMLHHFARSCRSTYEIARRTGLTQSAVVRKLKKYELVVGRST